MTDCLSDGISRGWLGKFTGIVASTDRSYVYGHYCPMNVRHLLAFPVIAELMPFFSKILKRISYLNSIKQGRLILVRANFSSMRVKWQTFHRIQQKCVASVQRCQMISFTLHVFSHEKFIF